MTTPDAEEVTAAWADSLVLAGGDRSAATASAEDLVGRYSAAQRHYHSLRHVAAVLRDAAWLASELEVDGGTQAVLALAVCAHDVVYDARPGADERASARWASDAVLAAGGSDEVARRVGELVLATLEHTADAKDLAAAALLDADLAILGAAPDGYDEYVAAVRLEYGAVPDEEWRKGRGRVLRGLLTRDRLYLSEAARERWDAAARANMGAELARLDGGVAAE